MLKLERKISRIQKNDMREKENNGLHPASFPSSLLLQGGRALK